MSTDFFPAPPTRLTYTHRTLYDERRRLPLSHCIWHIKQAATRRLPRCKRWRSWRRCLRWFAGRSLTRTSPFSDPGVNGNLHFPHTKARLASKWNPKKI